MQGYGFTRFGDDFVVAGFETEKKIYLAVWNLTDKQSVNVKINKTIKSAEVFYPKDGKVSAGYDADCLTVDFDTANSAVMLKIFLN